MLLYKIVVWERRPDITICNIVLTLSPKNKNRNKNKNRKKLSLLFLTLDFRNLA